MHVPHHPRVARVITRLNIGGPARQALLLTRDLRPAYETLLLAGTPATEEGELTDPAVEVQRVPLVRPLSPGIDARALWRVRVELARFRPDIVHTHMAKAGTLARTAARSLRPRPIVVHTYHGHVLDGYFGRARQRAFIEVERLLAGASDAIVAISPEVRDELLDLGIGRPDQYRLVPLGLDLDRHREVAGATGVLRSHLGLDADVPLVGIVGRLVSIKDLGTLLEAMVAVPDAHLAILGDGEERLALEARARDLGISERSHFTGWWTDVPTAISDLDLVALSSRNEGTPVSLIEAAACGRAVVATDVGGVRSVVVDGETGLLVAPGDHRAMAEAIRSLLRDARRRADMGRRARDLAVRFDQHRLVTDIDALYRELLTSRDGEGTPRG